MRNEEDPRWIARWPVRNVEAGKEETIINADPVKLYEIMSAMNLLHMNDATRAMLRDKYPETYARLLEAQYNDAEKRLVRLLNKGE